jgi:hypothetical protein
MGPVPLGIICDLGLGAIGILLMPVEPTKAMKVIKAIVSGICIGTGIAASLLGVSIK